MRMILVVLFCFVLATDSTFAQENGGAEALPSVMLPSALDRVLRDYERAWEARDAQALALLFAPDGFVLRSEYPPVRGREAIKQAYKNAGGPLHLRALDFARSDSIAYVIGGYRSAPDRPDGGKFILTLRRGSDGQWLIVADMDNRNR